MIKLQWALGALLLGVLGFSLGVPLHLTPAPPIVHAADLEHASLPAPEPLQIVLWNDQHAVVTDLVGEWEVRDTPIGTRMRPRHDDSRIRVYSVVEGIEHDYPVTTAGEVYMAFGWICVNQVHQESWGSQGAGPFKQVPCGDDPSACTVSYLRSDVMYITFNSSLCWRSAVQPPGNCTFKKHCDAGSGDCEVVIELVTGYLDTFVTACGSGVTVQQCSTSAGQTWICYCE